MRKFVIGDIHGNYKGLVQALERSGFNKQEDQLITLGDICDGYSEVYECVEELLTIPNRIDIVGNHDEPFTEWIESGLHPWRWEQGGLGTLKSYGFNCLGKEYDRFKIWYKTSGAVSNLNPGDIPETHKEFFKHQIAYYVDEDNNLFIHGGFNRHFPIKEQNPEFFCWDRDLWLAALSYEEVTSNEFSFKIKDNFKNIFLGHTATINWKTTEPMKAANIWNIDTGAGFVGKVTIMNVDTLNYWQSDLAETLYPDDLGRRKYKGTKFAQR